MKMNRRLLFEPSFKDMISSIGRRYFVWPALLLVALSSSTSIGTCGSDWSHPYAGEDGSAFLERENTVFDLRDIFVYDTVRLPVFLTTLLSGDVDGNGMSEIVGLTESMNAVWKVDMNGESSEELLSTPFANGTFELRALVDFDRDGAKDLILTQVDSLGSVVHRVYSVKKQDFLESVQAESDIAAEWIFTAIDVDFNSQMELIAFGESAGEEQFHLTIYHPGQYPGFQRFLLPGPVFESNVAVFQDVEFKETLIIAASETPQQNSNSSSSVAWVFAVLVPGDGNQAEVLWAKDLQPGLSVKRLALGQTIVGEKSVVVGTTRTVFDDPFVQASIVELSIDNGEALNESVLWDTDCKDLTVGNYDDDLENEIVYLDESEGLHRLDFSINRDRTLTVVSAEFYVGGGAIDGERYPDNALVQSQGQRTLITILNHDLNPWSGSYFTLMKGSLKSRPIFGDTDDNGACEVLFIADDDGPTVNRVYYFDAGKPSEPTVTPSPTPRPEPTPTPPASSGFGWWELYP